MSPKIIASRARMRVLSSRRTLVAVLLSGGVPDILASSPFCPGRNDVRHIGRVSPKLGCVPRAFAVSLLASARAHCCRHIWVFVMTEPFHRFSLAESSRSSDVPSANASTSLRCSLRIFRLCHNPGHGRKWCCSTKHLARVSTSPVMSRGNSSSGTKGVALAHTLLSSSNQVRGFKLVGG